jgi:S1-C subfamily serine protease
MKKWMGAILVLLLGGVVGGGVLYLRLSNSIDRAQSQIETLKSDLSKLQGVAPAAAPTTALSAAITMIDLISAVQPVVARVEVTGAGFQASGSAVVIRADGRLITNAHVVESSTSIFVTLNSGERYPATVTSSDANVDLAILKLTGSPAGLPVATLGSASDVVIGGVAVAAGFPLGADLPGPASFTQGIISAIRTLDGQRYVQTDVQINPGNSGGALVARASGRVIGITSAGVVPRGQDIEGIGLAIPIDVVQTYIAANLTR